MKVEHKTLPAHSYQPYEVWFPLSEDILAWDQDFHELMLNDQLRMQAYEAAIKEAVKPGMTIVDIGTGTGILSLWAAQAGARKIYGIDANPNRQIQAEERLHTAGFDAIYEFRFGLSYDIELPEQVDMCISEILGNLGDKEDMTPILKDARRRFLKDDGVMLPQSVTTSLVPVDAAQSHNQVATVAIKSINPSYDLQTLMEKLEIKNPFDLYYDVILPRTTYLAEPADVAAFHFGEEDRSTYKVAVQYTVTNAGVFSGFKGYFIAQLSDRVTLNIEGDDITHRQTSDCWKHCYLPVEQTIEVQPGDTIHLVFERYYPSKLVSPFRQGYAWSGRVERGGDIIAQFAQQTASRI